MNILAIELDRLMPHPANSNVMPDRLLSKLADHIAASARYPPLIVRPITLCNDHDQGAAPLQTYQILDGHHRAQALRKLDRRHADCIVWQADDQEALVLLATLNRLQGQDDPRKRAALVGALASSYNLSAIAGMLPERREQIKKLLEINAKPPQIRPPQPIEQMPLVVHFFLLPKHKARLEKTLKEIGGTREQALMKLLSLHGQLQESPSTN